MNYLAHSYLSCGDEDLMLGNLITDMITKKDEDAYEESIQKGIDLHRMIDTFTDSHPIVSNSLQLIYPTQGKYAPVVLDILWDYFLSRNWSHFSGEEINPFSQNIYSLLEKNYGRLQPKIVKRFERMIQVDWLQSCMTRERLRSTFTHLHKRTKFKSNFGKVDEILDAHEEQLNDSFMRLFPEMISYVEANCSC